jgi:hypothetical protein
MRSVAPNCKCPTKDSQVVRSLAHPQQSLPAKAFRSLWSPRKVVKFQGVLLPSQRLDSVGVEPLITGIDFEALIVDKAFDNNALRTILNERGAVAVIPGRNGPFSFRIAHRFDSFLVGLYILNLPLRHRLAFRLEGGARAFTLPANYRVMRGLVYFWRRQILTRTRASSGLQPREIACPILLNAGPRSPPGSANPLTLRALPAHWPGSSSPRHQSLFLELPERPLAWL